MGDLPVADESTILSRELLQGLYALGAETVHVVTGAGSVLVMMRIAGEADTRELSFPAGNYLIARVAALPTEHAGLFGVRAPRPLAGKPRGQGAEP